MSFLADLPLNFFIFTSLYFEVFIMITYFEKRGSMKAEESMSLGGPLPSISVIVPCLNEGKTLPGTIESLLQLDYPKDKLSIFIVDDGSTDNTLAIANRFKKESNVKIFSKKNGGKHHALNFGLQMVTTDLVGCLDADSFVEKNALKKMVTYFKDKATMAVTPSIRVHNPKTIFQKIQSIEYSYGIFIRKMLSYLGAIYVTPGPFSIFRREVFEKIGNYRFAYHTEDIEIALRMQSKKFKIVNCHEAYVDTVTPRNFKGLYKQRIRWTYGFLKNAFDYRFMFFKKEYGNLGFLALPLAPIYIASTLYLFFTLMTSFSSAIGRRYAAWQVAGLYPQFENFSFGNLYFLNTDSKTLLLLVSVFFLLTTLYLGHKLANKRIKFLDFFYSFILYGFISPSWLFASVYKAVFGKSITWR